MSKNQNDPKIINKAKQTEKEKSAKQILEMKTIAFSLDMLVPPKNKETWDDHGTKEAYVAHLINESDDPLLLALVQNTAAINEKCIGIAKMEQINNGWFGRISEQVSAIGILVSKFLNMQVDNAKIANFTNKIKGRG